MAKSELIGQFKSQVILDKSTNLVMIKALKIEDPELFEIISAQEKAARLEFVKRALKVGAIALRDVVIREKIDYVKREFQGLCFELDKIFHAQLGREGMKGELDKIFGENGKLQHSLEKLFGDEGKLVRDILDMDNRRSPIGQLRQTIESYFVGKDSEMYGMLDPNKKDSPMSRMKREIMDELRNVRSMIEEDILKREIIKKTTKKGFTFEDTLYDFLLLISKPFNDTVERVGKERGKLGNLKGDFLITISDRTIKGSRSRIVVEAKTGEAIRLTRKGLLGELDEAIENREAKLAIAVTESPISEPVGSYREIEQDKIICAFGDDGLPLEVAYKVARTRLLMDVYKESEREVDIARINGIAEKIRNDLNSMQGIKAKLTSIGNTSEAIKNDIRSLETNIRDSLTELQDSLRSDTSLS